MKKQRSTSTTSKRMTRKQALAVLFRMRSQWIEDQTMQQFDATAPLRHESFDALDVLTKLVFAPRQLGQFTIPCKVCYQRYAEQIVYQQGETISTWCCTPCRDCLREEGKLVEAPEASSEVS